MSSLNTIAVHEPARRIGTPSPASILLAAGMVVIGGNESPGGQICKPQLTFKEVRFSAPQNLLRKWSARIDVDASRCAAASGRFDIRFVRLKEATPDLEFTEQLTWRAGPLEVSIDFWTDEAVHDYSIAYVAPCPCRQ